MDTVTEYMVMVTDLRWVEWIIKHQERQLTLILLTISLLDVQLRETMLMVSIETTRVVL